MGRECKEADSSNYYGKLQTTGLRNRGRSLKRLLEDWQERVNSDLIFSRFPKMQTYLIYCDTIP